jgi:hypothetical protein
VSLGDGIRRFFAKKNNPALQSLEVFVAERKGIEGYIEPRTSTSPTTLLLVDRDGDHLRAPVREPEDAVVFCERHHLPVYDAQVIGYPKRMRDFERRRRTGVADSIDEEIEALEKRLSQPDPEMPDE